MKIFLLLSNMNSVRFITLFTCSFMFSVTAFADPTWTGSRSIESIDGQQGGLHLVLEGDPLPGVDMACHGGRRQVLMLGTSNYDVLSALMMTAFSSGKRVNIQYDAGVGTCGAKVLRVIVVS